MKPSSRIEATIEILSKGHLARVPLDTTVGDYMRVRRYIGSKDRGEIAEVGQVDRRLDQILEAGAGRSEHEAEVVQHAPGLELDVPRDQLTGARVDGDLAAQEHEVAG